MSVDRRTLDGWRSLRFTISVAVAASAMALAWYHKLRGKWLDAFDNVHEHHEVFLKQLKQFSLQELQAATDDFSGKVYKGRLREGIVVAVKRLVGFRNEIEVSNMASHRNLLHIQGFCMTKTERILVYSYMENGSLTSC